MNVDGHVLAFARGPESVVEFRQMLFAPDECRLSGLERSGKQPGAALAARAQHLASRRPRLRQAVAAHCASALHRAGKAKRSMKFHRARASLPIQARPANCRTRRYRLLKWTA